MPSRVRYRSFSAYLQQRFGGPVRKLSVNAGFTCPNRDGTISDTGCVYCDPDTFSPHPGPDVPPIIHQLRAGIEAGHRRGVKQFLAYFQSFTNTYAPPAKLKDVYDAIRAFPEIKGLAIGTRPDCVDAEVLNVISAFIPEYEVWLEYGLQSIHDQTLVKINRGHGAQAFFEAMALTRQHPGIKVCAHVILGLPEETTDMERETAQTVARLRLEGIKFHPLHVVSKTPLAEAFAKGHLTPVSREAYTERVVRFMEHLWPDTVIQRLTADCADERLVAPKWLLDKNAVLREIQDRLEQEDTWQGKLYQVR